MTTIQNIVFYGLRDKAKDLMDALSSRGVEVQEITKMAKPVGRDDPPRVITGRNLAPEFSVRGDRETINACVTEFRDSHPDTRVEVEEENPREV
jgi:hypothetical protein